MYISDESSFICWTSAVTFQKISGKSQFWVRRSIDDKTKDSREPTRETGTHPKKRRLSTTPFDRDDKGSGLFFLRSETLNKSFKVGRRRQKVLSWKTTYSKNNDDKKPPTRKGRPHLFRLRVYESLFLGFIQETAQNQDPTWTNRLCLIKRFIGYD